MEWMLGGIWAAFSYLYLPSDWPRIHVCPVQQVAGWICIAIGVMIMATSLAWLGLRRTHGLDPAGLIQSGPYRLTRNPQLMGFGLSMIGFALLWPSPHMFVSLLLLAVLSQLMVKTEEEHLIKRHGEEYRAYCQRTPRYIRLPPGIHGDAA